MLQVTLAGGFLAPGSARIHCVLSSVSHKDTSHWIGADMLIQGNLLLISLIAPARTLCLNKGHRGSALETGFGLDWLGIVNISLSHL